MSNLMDTVDHVLNWLWTAFAAAFAYLWKLRKDDLNEIANALDKKADRVDISEMMHQCEQLRKADAHMGDSINAGFADLRDRIAALHVNVLERLDGKADK